MVLRFLWDVRRKRQFSKGRAEIGFMMLLSALFPARLLFEELECRLTQATEDLLMSDPLKHRFVRRNTKHLEDRRQVRESKSWGLLKQWIRRWWWESMRRVGAVTVCTEKPVGILKPNLKKNISQSIKSNLFKRNTSTKQPRFEIILNCEGDCIEITRRLQVYSKYLCKQSHADRYPMVQFHDQWSLAPTVPLSTFIFTHHTAHFIHISNKPFDRKNRYPKLKNKLLYYVSVLLSETSLSPKKDLWFIG